MPTSINKKFHGFSIYSSGVICDTNIRIQTDTGTDGQWQIYMPLKIKVFMWFAVNVRQNTHANKYS